MPNRNYRGIYRMVASRPEHIERGFDDPVLNEELVDENGLNPAYEAAEKSIDEFSQIYQRESMEVIFVRSPESPWEGPLRNQKLELLGYDVAGDAPFYSIVADMPADPRIANFARLLNASGLFDRPDDA